MVKCLSCGGVFTPVLPDGMQYFHACPSLSVVEIAAAVAALKIVLPIDPATGLPETPTVAFSRRVYERANKRDENVVANGLLKSPGLGTAAVAAPPPAVVVV